MIRVSCRLVIIFLSLFFFTSLKNAHSSSPTPPFPPPLPADSHSAAGFQQDRLCNPAVRFLPAPTVTVGRTTETENTHTYNNNNNNRPPPPPSHPPVSIHPPIWRAGGAEAESIHHLNGTAREASVGGRRIQTPVIIIMRMAFMASLREKYMERSSSPCHGSVTEAQCVTTGRESWGLEVNSSGFTVSLSCKIQLDTTY